MNESAAPDQPGYYRSIHHSEYTEPVKALRMDGSHILAKLLLEGLLDAIEAENRTEQLGVDFWHYERLATIYHAEGDYATEIAVLERYERQPGSFVGLFAARITRIRTAFQHPAPAK